ncbi:hypothetical protein F5B21DRAFT_281427 [Xylaria acuta]|nr:hypothetical protein F5B21DRAFT_281427 [Xylaria acuta]
MTCRRKQPRYYREKEWKPPYDLVIPSQYPAQYILPPPGYNPTPGYHSAPGYYPASNYQYAPGYYPASNYQYAQGYQPAPRYPSAPNYQSFQSYQPIAAPQHSMPMLPAPSTIVPYQTVHPQYQVQPFTCKYGLPSYYPPPAYNTSPPPHY